MPWVWLLLAGVLEVAWAVGLKYTAGLTRWLPSLLTVLAMLGSFACLALAVREIPLGTGYAVWTGIGVMGTTLFGIWLLGESTSPLRLACLGLILLGIVGLKLTAGP